MRFDLAFQLVDFPQYAQCEWYRQAARMMLESARHAFPAHDVRFVQLTDEASQVIDGVDVRFTPAVKVEREELMQYRGYCTAEWALMTDRPVIVCDVDILWNNDGIVQLLEPINGQRLDINLFSRPQNAFQPFNGGLFTTQPGQTLFWETYKRMMKTLPNDCKGWWGDQIALGVMCGAPEPEQKGAVRFGSQIGYIPIDMVAPSPKSQPTQLLDTPSVHWKGGKRKKDPWMSEYFAMLQQSWTKREAAE
jgi:hypothetical protein